MSTLLAPVERTALTMLCMPATWNGIPAQVPPSLQQASLSGIRTALLPQLLIAVIAAWSISPSKKPLPCTHEYSPPDRLTPHSVTCLPLASSSLLPDTCSCGAGPPPVEAPVSVTLNVADVNPAALAVNVAAPVPEESAVIVTFCA